MNTADSSTPKYKMIAADIEQKIMDGTLKSGELLNSELKTQQEYNVSRVTVRKAYQLLAKKGIIRTVHGVGTFVNDLYTKDWTWMSSFSSEVLKTGHVPTPRGSSNRPQSCSQCTGFHHQTSVMWPVHRFLRSNPSQIPRPQGSRIKRQS